MADRAPGTKRRRSPALVQWLAIYVGVVVVTGLITGIVWNRVVRLPSYVLGDDYRATIGESGLNQIAGTDVAFAATGLVTGLIMGAVAWQFFRHQAAWVTLIAAVGAAVAGLICLCVGEFIGPRQFADRVAGADAGESVRIDFAATTWVPLVVWIGAAMVPLVVGAIVRRERWISHTSDAAAGGPVLAVGATPEHPDR